MQDLTPHAKRRIHLRLAGTLALVIGIACACGLYWAETRSPDVKDDISMVGYDRAQVRQMGQLYGKSGVMIDELMADLKSPGLHATAIVVVSAIIALGCFQYERHRNDENEGGS